jgi:3-phosphoinositide dependent protein kinase-1
MNDTSVSSAASAIHGTDGSESAQDFRLRGNHEFAAGRCDNAAAFYTAALETAGTWLRDNSNSSSTTAMATATDEIILNSCNRSACYFIQEEYERAAEDAATAWQLSHRTSVKAAFRLAKTAVALKDYPVAKATIQAALQVIDRQDLDIIVPPGTEPTTEQAYKIKTAAHQRQSLQELYQQVLKAAYDKPVAPETTIKFAQRPVSIREFTKGEALGYGNFSEIVVVTHKETAQVFALKLITKKQAADLAKRQHPNVYNEISMERRVLLERLGSHPNVVQMYHAFQDYNTLYYLMDLHISWSDLWSEIRSGGVMVGCHRRQIQQWMYELLDACEHMHSAGIVHRDLKPENILLTGGGHIVVIDFGTAKDLIKTELNGPEFVGTPDFMSPEAVNGTSGMQEAAEAALRGEIGATHAADLWAVGAIAFILTTGMTPFWSASPYLGFLRIKRCLLRRSAAIADDDAWDFIRSLMQLDPAKRLGADAFALVVVEGTTRRMEKKRPDGYDVIRNHAYFAQCRADPLIKEKTPVPSLRDLCIRATADLALKDSLDLDVCDAHPPGDGSRHDMTRLSPRDKACVMHVLDRRKLLRDARLYARFFTDPTEDRLDRVRPDTRDFIGWTQMNDDQGKPAKAMMNDPYATPIEADPIQIVYVTNPLLCAEFDKACDEETRKKYTKLFKKCIANINRNRPKMVVVSGCVNDKLRKVLARVSESIPVVVHDGSAFFTFWLTGVQCIAVKSSAVSEDSEQIAWLREQMEQVRMSKHPLFVFSDGDPRDLPVPLLKRLARGRTLSLMGVCNDESLVDTKIAYAANEIIDDASVRSTDSVEDEKDEFTMKVQTTRENGLRWITVGETPDDWGSEFKPIDLL